jgi:tRNA uridine 5-carbamoylmethylation protein Kti12
MKTIIITRAVPGSGKTTITNCILDELKANNLEVAIHSTDEFFMVGNKYVFDIEKLGEYHDKNLENFEKSLIQNKDVVICDNTNIMPWQTKPYTKLARKFGYKIIIITLDPRELEKHMEAQKVTHQKPDAHGVEKEILKRMIDEYYQYDDLLNPNIVIDETKHIHYVWNSETKQKEPASLAKHFDSDKVIRIMPDEYRKIQKSIGRKVLSLIKG